MKKTAEAKLNRLFERYPALESCRESIMKAVEIMIDSYANGGKLMVCGNGGSAADSLHVVGELMKGFVLPRKLPPEMCAKLQGVAPEHAQYLIDNLQGAMPAISLVSELGLSTAFSNDQAPDLAFAQQVLGQGRKGDVLLGITTSGNSANVLYAADVANAMGVHVIGLTGQKPAKLDGCTEVCIKAPSKETYEIQEYHLPIYHALCLALEEQFFGEATAEA